MDDNEFIKNLILIIAPIVIGSLLAPTITNRIQDRNAKILRKKELIDAFVHSVKMSFALMDHFIRYTNETYSNAPDTDKILETAEVTFTYNFPTNEEDLPKRKLETKWIELDKNLANTRVINSEFISFIRLYVDDESVLEDLQNILSHLQLHRFTIKKILDVVNLKDFANIMKESHEQRIELKKIIISFEMKLMDLKIKKVQV